MEDILPVTGIGLAIILSAWILLIILWILLPFAVFGVKTHLRLLREEAEESNDLLDEINKTQTMILSELTGRPRGVEGEVDEAQVTPGAGYDEPHRDPKVWTPADDIALAKMHKMGMSVSDLAKHLGRTEGAVSARLLRMGYIRKCVVRAGVEVQYSSCQIVRVQSIAPSGAVPCMMHTG